MEYFDVINSNGEYLDKIESREKCHSEGLWHRAVVSFIINSKKQILLQKRSKYKKMWPNLWDVIGGHVLTGELGYQAIIRETKEEMGIDLKKEEIMFIGATTSSDKKGDIINNHFNEYYICFKDIDINDLKLQEEEVSEARWFEKDEVVKMIEDNYNGITDKTGVWNHIRKYYRDFI